MFSRRALQWALFSVASAAFIAGVASPHSALQLLGATVSAALIATVVLMDEPHDSSEATAMKIVRFAAGSPVFTRPLA